MWHVYNQLNTNCLTNLVGRSEKFVEIFNFEKRFSNGTFDQIRINFKPNYSDSYIFKLRSSIL